MIDDFSARGVQRLIFTAALQRLVFFKQLEVLPQLGPELGDLGQVIVIGGAQLGCINHGVQMTDHAPGASESLGDALQWQHKFLPAEGRPG